MSRACNTSIMAHHGQENTPFEQIRLLFLAPLAKATPGRRVGQVTSTIGSRRAAGACGGTAGRRGATGATRR